MSTTANNETPKGFIYLHPSEGFTFLENVPEKPKKEICIKGVSSNLCSHILKRDCDCLVYENKFKAYERALAESIEKRMVIGNPEVIEELWKNNVRDLKEGELYPWPGTYKIDFVNSNDYLAGAQKKVVILSPPKEDRKYMGVTPIAHMIDETLKSEPVNSSMSYSESHGDIWPSDTLGISKMSRPALIAYVHKLLQKTEPVVSQDQEPDAVRFANWISLENWSPVESGGLWQRISPGWITERLTTSELYELFTRKPID